MADEQPSKDQPCGCATTTDGFGKVGHIYCMAHRPSNDHGGSNPLRRPDDGSADGSGTGGLTAPPSGSLSSKQRDECEHSFDEAALRAGDCALCLYQEIARLRAYIDEYCSEGNKYVAENVRLRAELEKWKAYCTGKHGSAMLCVQPADEGKE